MSAGAYRTAELAEIYDVVYADVPDDSFWLSMAAAVPQGPILDLACGTGRVLLLLARAGSEVVGLDLSPVMLERCRAHLRKEPADVRGRVTLVQADMTSFDLGRKVGAVFCPFNSFHHLRSADDQLACLGRCHAHLPPQGLLVLDLFNPDPAPPEQTAESRGVASSDGERAEVFDWSGGRRISKWMSACRYRWSEQSNECEMTYQIVEPDGATRRLTETFFLRLIYRYELEHLLARSGFRLVRLYGDYDRSPFAAESLGMIAVALRGPAISHALVDNGGLTIRRVGSRI